MISKRLRLTLASLIAALSMAARAEDIHLPPSAIPTQADAGWQSLKAGRRLSAEEAEHIARDLARIYAHDLEWRANHPLEPSPRDGLTKSIDDLRRAAALRKWGVTSAGAQVWRVFFTELHHFTSVPKKNRHLWLESHHLNYDIPVSHFESRRGMARAMADYRKWLDHVAEVTAEQYPKFSTQVEQILAASLKVKTKPLWGGAENLRYLIRGIGEVQRLAAAAALDDSFAKVLRHPFDDYRLTVNTLGDVSRIAPSKAYTMDYLTRRLVFADETTRDFWRSHFDLFHDSEMVNLVYELARKDHRLKLTVRTTRESVTEVIRVADGENITLTLEALTPDQRLIPLRSSEIYVARELSSTPKKLHQMIATTVRLDCDQLLKQATSPE